MEKRLGRLRSLLLVLIRAVEESAPFAHGFGIGSCLAGAWLRLGIRGALAGRINVC